MEKILSHFHSKIFYQVLAFIKSRNIKTLNMDGTNKFLPGTKQFHPGTKWFQPQVDSVKVILLLKLVKKFFQNLTLIIILEFWERKNFENLTLVKFTIPPRSSNLEPRSSNLEPGGCSLELTGSRWNQVGFPKVSHTVLVHSLIFLHFFETETCSASSSTSLNYC